jgi:hypothetical protein
MGINRRCLAELSRDQLGDERDLGRTPDQQDRIKLRAVDGQQRSGRLGTLSAGLHQGLAHRQHGATAP